MCDTDLNVCKHVFPCGLPRSYSDPGGRCSQSGLPLSFSSFELRWKIALCNPRFPDIPSMHSAFVIAWFQASGNQTGVCFLAIGKMLLSSGWVTLPSKKALQAYNMRNQYFLD
jgi:hypothetical protein